MKNQLLPFYLLGLLVICINLTSTAQVNQQKVDSLNQVISKLTDNSSKIPVLLALSKEYHRKDELSYKSLLLEADSLLKNTASTFVDDKTYIDIHNRLAYHYIRYYQLDSAVIHADLVLNRAKELNHAGYIITALQLQFRIASREDKIEDQLAYCKESFELAKAVDSLKHIGVTGLNLSLPYRKLNKFDKALECLNESLEAAKKIDYVLLQGTILTNIAVIYQDLGFDDKFLQHTFESKKIHEKHDYKERLMDNLMDLAKYYKREDIDSLNLAAEYAMQGLELAEQTKLPSHLLVFPEILIDINIRQDKKDKVEKYVTILEKNYQLVPETHKKKFSNYQTAKAQYFIYTKQYDKAYSLLKFVNENTTSERYDKQLRSQVHQQLAQVYAYKNNGTKALEHVQHAQMIKDSISSATSVRQLAYIEANKTNIENEKEIELLEKDKALLAANAKQNRTMAAGIGLLALLGFGFFWNARRKNRLISQQKEQLEAVNQTKDRIFAIIGHDLRKPALAFRGITKKVNYLLENKDYETLNELGNEIENDALSLGRLIDNLLSWSLSQREVMPYNPTSLRVADAVDETLALFEKAAKNKDIQLSSNISDDLEVYADSNALSTIIRNLLDNAIKYTNPGGEVKIEADTSTKGVRIKVSDTGVGMKEDKLKDIFLLQKNKSTKGTDNEKGTGLGMHLVKELVKINKGTIDVISQLNQGTHFDVYLPTKG